eukprot:TRINITY_DN2009_c0_g1_i7.p1 TRINITY_DN2009_c0_g1~~TRINITY_DN2009_c0_g1_i7.p1  ORF type:complete len:285 (+),score=22.72 TRINITY_DN2009_c0_g1_i7:2-856(+)
MTMMPTINDDGLSMYSGESETSLPQKGGSSLIQPKPLRMSRVSSRTGGSDKSKNRSQIQGANNNSLTSDPTTNVTDVKCRCIKVKNDNTNIMAHTPLLVRWCYAEILTCINVFKVSWSYRSADPIYVECHTKGNRYKQNEMIEMDVVVYNNCVHEIDLVCLMDDEYWSEGNSVIHVDSVKPSSAPATVSGGGYNIVIPGTSVRTETKPASHSFTYVELMAMGLEKRILYGILRPDQKMSRKLRIYPLKSGILQINELTFFDLLSSNQFKVAVSFCFEIYSQDQS